MSTPRNITVLGPAHPFRGGIAAFGQRLAQAFLADGHQLRLMTFTTQYPDFMFPGKTQFTDDPAPDDLIIERVFSSIGPLSWRSGAKKLSEWKTDLLISHFWLPAMAPSMASIAHLAKRKNKQLKHVSIAHNVVPHEGRFGDGALTNYYLKSCDAAIVMSAAVEEDLKQMGFEKPVAQIPHPIYDHYGALIDKRTARAALGIHEEDQVVLFFGLIRHYKGLDLLIKAMGDERLKASNIKLLIAGECYEELSVYEDLINSLDLKHRVKADFIFIPDEKVRHYFRAADILALPYRTATQSGITQMGYHFEIPMLVTRVGGLPEIVPHGKVGYVVEPEPAAIADALHDFFDQQRAADFEGNSKIEKKRFSWERMSTGIIELASR